MNNSISKYSGNVEDYLNYFSIGIIVVDSKFNINMVNDELIKIIGYKKEDLIFHHIKKVFNNKTSDIIIRELKQIKLNSSDIVLRPFEININQKNTTSNTFLITIIHITIQENKFYFLLFHDISHFKSKISDLKNRAYYDHLTSIPNRTLLLDRARMAILKSSRDQDQLAFLYIDIDDFKEINDKHGHHAGDLFLKKISLYFIECIRESDTLARIGGDEFLILMLKINSIDDVNKLIKRIRKTCLSPIKIDNTNIYPKISIGTSIFPDDGIDVESLIKKS